MGHLRVRHIGKAYKRYARKWGRLAEWLGLGVHHDLNWVVRDVTFDVAPGEAVGIVGANGAGKSTLLKIITGTVRPTAGTFEIGGRVSALLELGIGFHPEFSGRQNVYMAGHILGIPGDHLATLMGDIEAFAEIGDYMDQPVRTYSSGMQVRLAFSIATAVRPNVLIVDEALSVGDTYFQHKSFGRIRQFREAGTTLLLVSHSADTVKTLCDRAILLDHGVLLRDGTPDAVLDYYNALVAAQHSDYDIRQIESGARGTVTRSGSSEVSIEGIELLVGDEPAGILRSGDPATIRLRITGRAAVPQLTAGVLIRDRLGNDVFGTNTYYLGAQDAHIESGERVVIDFAFAAVALGVGSYSVTVALHAGPAHTISNYDWWDRALVFQVVPGDGPTSIGSCALPVQAVWRAAGWSNTNPDGSSEGPDNPRRLEAAGCAPANSGLARVSAGLDQP